MIKRLFTDLYADENVLYFNEISGNVVFICNGMSILNVDLNNINLDNTKRKELKKELNEELMPKAWHPKKWWNFCMLKDK